MDSQSALERLRSYETVIDTMHCGLVAEDVDGTVVFINQRLLGWLCYEKDEVVGQHVSMLAPPELRELLEEDMHAAEEGDLRARLLAIRRKDSTTFPVITIPQRFFDEEENFDGYFSIVVDLGAVLTARQIGPAHPVDIRETLGRIAMELQSICLSAVVGSASVPLHHPEIAERLHISQHTVRNHLKSMYRKLDVGTQSELIEFIRSLASAAAEQPAA